jgi:hypothetical protein
MKRDSSICAATGCHPPRTAFGQTATIESNFCEFRRRTTVERQAATRGVSRNYGEDLVGVDLSDQLPRHQLRLGFFGIERRHGGFGFIECRLPWGSVTPRAYSFSGLSVTIPCISRSECLAIRNVHEDCPHQLFQRLSPRQGRQRFVAPLRCGDACKSHKTGDKMLA